MDTACFNNLVGLKSLCPTTGPQPLYWLDDIEGIDQQRLAQLANPIQGSGKNLAEDIIDSSIRLMLADIDSLIPGNYQLSNQLVNVCSSCSYSVFYGNVSGAGTGVIVKDVSRSQFSQILISSVRVKVESDGNYTLKIDDGKNVKTIDYPFVGGQELVITGVNYVTSEKQVKIYFDNPDVRVAQISCPPNSSCGCGGNKNTLAKDLVIVGYSAGVETTTQYGILPCAIIACSYDSIVCNLVKTSPRLFGLALLYKAASKVFATNVESQRVNRTASFDQEEKQSDADKYEMLYRERLKGNTAKGVTGIAQAINNNLKVLKDKCVVCNSPFGVAWATG